MQGLPRPLLVASLALLVAGLLGAALWTSTAQADGHRQEGTWSPGGRLNVDRDSDHTATRLDDGRVLLVGGGRDGRATAEVWDPETRQTSLVASPHEWRQDHRAIRLDDGRVLVVGGNIAADAAEIYDPDADEWTETAPLEHARTEGHTLTPLGDGRVIVVGGRGPTAAAEIFDPDATAEHGEWTTVASMDEPRENHTATLVEEGRVLVAGGDSGGESRFTLSASTQIYNEAQDEWTSVAPTGYERDRHAATRLPDGRVLITGGRGNPAPSTAQHGSDDITAEHAWSLEQGWGELFDFAQDQSFEFTIEEAGLPSGSEVTINLDDAKDGGVDYEDDDSLYTSDRGDVRAQVTEDTAEITFTAAETITAGITVSVDGDGVALTPDAEQEHQAVFTRHDTGGSEAANFMVTTQRNLAITEIFNPDDGTWQEAASSDRAGYRSAVLLDDGSVLAIGGNTTQGVERYDPGADEWWPTDGTKEHRGQADPTLLENGHVLLAAGFDGDTAEVYSPETIPEPIVDSVTPEQGSVDGGFEVTITGENLDDVIFATFGEFDFRVSDVVEESSEQLRVHTPPHPAGFASVRVATPGGLMPVEEAPRLQFFARDGDWAPTGDLWNERSSPGTVVLDGPACEADSPPDYCGQALLVERDTSELYDPEDGVFRQAGPLPEPVRRPIERTVLLDGPACRGDQPPDYCGNVLVNDTRESSVSFMYDPQDDAWRPCGDENTFDCPPSVEDFDGGSWERATLIDGPECHDADGEAPDYCGTVLMNMFNLGDEPIMWLFDPASGEWTQAATPNEPREIFAMTLVEGDVCEGDDAPAACGNVLIASGREFQPGVSRRTETAELYDPAEDEWRDTNEDPAPGRARASATTLPDGRIVVAGGYLDPVPSAAAEIFDPVDESWEPLPDMPMAVEGHGSVLLPDGRVMIAGGNVRTPSGASQSRTPAAMVLDPDSARWSYTDTMSHGRRGAGGSPHDPLALVQLPDEQVLIAGGDPDGDTAEVYQLADGAIAGNVSDADTGDPINGAEVTVTDGGEQVGVATTDSNGSYRVSVPFGEYTVTADAEGFETQSRDDVTVNAGETSMAEFALSPVTEDSDDDGTTDDDTTDDDTTDDDTTDDDTTDDDTTADDTEEPGSITGTVSDAETGDAVAGAEITVLDGGTTVVTAGTDEQGAYTITGLEPGDYTLTVEADGFASASQDVTVESGETVTASFSLDPVTEVGRLEGVVTDADTGDPVVGAEMTVLDDGERVVTAGTDTAGAYWVENLAPGGYTVTVDADGFEPASQTVTVTAGATTTADFALQPVGVAPAGLTNRIAGADRFATAAELSAQRFDSGVEVAYVATGLEFADALTGGVAAALDDGPVLLAATDMLPDATAAELDRLDPQRIVLLGGTAALSDDVETAAAEFTDGSVDRLAGADRFATAAEVSGALFPGGADTVYVGTGLNFPDVLAGVPAAAGAPGPMLLTTGDTVPQATAAELDRLDPDRVVILGGTAAVGEAVEAELADHGTVDRLAGANRFATAAELSAAEFADAAAVDRVYVATGLEFADALAAGAVAGSEDVPVLLVTTDSVPDPTAAELGRLDPDEVVVMGGTAAVADSVEQQLDELVDG